MFELIMLALATAVFVLLGAIALYYAVKPYRDEDDETEYMDPILMHGGALSVVPLFFKAVLWICKKLFPRGAYIIVFRTVSFLFGVLLCGLAVLIWVIRAASSA